MKLRGAQRPDQRKHRLLHHHRHAQASNGSIRRLVALSHHLRWDPRELELDLEPPPFSTLLFFRPPALSYHGGVSCEAPRRYRTPHGVLCVRMFVTFGGGKEVVAALCSIAAASGQSM